MRIAVLVYGRLNKCAEHYNNIIDSIGKEHNIDFFCSSDNSSEELLKDFIRLYKPISYINDKIDYTLDLSRYPKRHETNVDSMIRHFINKNRVFTLLEKYIENNKNIEYDIIISLRVDLLFQNKFNFNISNIKDSNSIFIPYINNYFGVNDQLAYGNYNTMNKYMNIINNCVYLIENYSILVNPEIITKKNIEFYELQVNNFDISYIIDK